MIAPRDRAAPTLDVDFSGFESIPAPKLAWRMGMVSLLMVFSTTLVDFYYKMHADQKYAGDVRELTSFFGWFYFWVGVTTLAARTVITPWILRKSSAFAGLLASPIALAVMTAVNVWRPGLWSAAAFKLTDSAMSHSVYRSCQEMLYTPLPTNWVWRLKSRSDGVFGRYGLLLAGVFLAGVSPSLEMHGPTALLPWAFLALAAWAVAVALLQREYKRQGNHNRALELALVETTPIAAPVKKLILAAEPVVKQAAA